MEAWKEQQVPQQSPGTVVRLGDGSSRKQQSCGHVGSAADRWPQEPCLGQCVEAAARLVPRLAVMSVFHRVFSESTWPWGWPPALLSMVAADGFLTARTWLINSSQILRRSQHIFSRNVNFNLFKFNGKTYGGERKANLK